MANAPQARLQVAEEAWSYPTSLKQRPAHERVRAALTA
jgi:hypothetical protein